MCHLTTTTINKRCSGRASCSFLTAGTAGLPHEGQAAARSVSHVDTDRRFFCAQHTLPITAVRNGKWYHSGDILGPPASIPTYGILVNKNCLFPASENKQTNGLPTTHVNKSHCICPVIKSIAFGETPFAAPSAMCGIETKGFKEMHLQHLWSHDNTFEGGRQLPAWGQSQDMHMLYNDRM